MAYLAYLNAEIFHMSGILAWVVFFNVLHPDSFTDQHACCHDDHYEPTYSICLQCVGLLAWKNFRTNPVLKMGEVTEHPTSLFYWCWGRGFLKAYALSGIEPQSDTHLRHTLKHNIDENVYTRIYHSFLIKLFLSWQVKNIPLFTQACH
jgi:hypothetical protein